MEMTAIEAVLGGIAAGLGLVWIMYLRSAWSTRGRRPRGDRHRERHGPPVIDEAHEATLEDMERRRAEVLARAVQDWRESS